ncbi:MAG: SRPBCC family protein [Betaproteobacteria bacterium]
MKVTFTGPPAGVGAGYEWFGNKEVGEGRLGIIESRPSDLVRLKLEFLKPFTATNTAEFTFKPEGNGTVVTWSMFGNKSFISKVMGLVMNMDKMVGGQFEKGLADMKATAEAGAK